MPPNRWDKPDRVQQKWYPKYFHENNLFLRQMSNFFLRLTDNEKYNNKRQLTNENWTKLISDRHEIYDNVLEMMEMYSNNCETKGKTLNCPFNCYVQGYVTRQSLNQAGLRSFRFTVTKPRERYFFVSFFLFLPLCHDVTAFLPNIFWRRLDIYK